MIERMYLASYTQIIAFFFRRTALIFFFFFWWKEVVSTSKTTADEVNFPYCFCLIVCKNTTKMILFSPLKYSMSILEGARVKLLQLRHLGLEISKTSF